MDNQVIDFEFVSKFYKQSRNKQIQGDEKRKILKKVKEFLKQGDNRAQYNAYAKQERKAYFKKYQEVNRDYYRAKALESYYRLKDKRTTNADDKEESEDEECDE